VCGSGVCGILPLHRGSPTRLAPAQARPGPRSVHASQLQGSAHNCHVGCGRFAAADAAAHLAPRRAGAPRARMQPPRQPPRTASTHCRTMAPCSAACAPTSGMHVVRAAHPASVPPTPASPHTPHWFTPYARKGAITSSSGDRWPSRSAHAHHTSVTVVSLDSDHVLKARLTHRLLHLTCKQTETKHNCKCTLGLLVHGRHPQGCTRMRHLPVPAVPYISYARHPARRPFPPSHRKSSTHRSRAVIPIRTERPTVARGEEGQRVSQPASGAPGCMQGSAAPALCIRVKRPFPLVTRARAAVVTCLPGGGRAPALDAHAVTGLRRDRHGHMTLRTSVDFMSVKMGAGRF
jgi:hypothetical protein